MLLTTFLLGTAVHAFAALQWTAIWGRSCNHLCFFSAFSLSNPKKEPWITPPRRVLRCSRRAEAGCSWPYSSARPCTPRVVFGTICQLWRTLLVKSWGEIDFLKYSYEGRLGGWQRAPGGVPPRHGRARLRGSWNHLSTLGAIFLQNLETLTFKILLRRASRRAGAGSWWPFLSAWPSDLGSFLEPFVIFWRNFPVKSRPLKYPPEGVLGGRERAARGLPARHGLARLGRTPVDGVLGTIWDRSWNHLSTFGAISLLNFKMLTFEVPPQRCSRRAGEGSFSRSSSARHCTPPRRFRCTSSALSHSPSTSFTIIMHHHQPHSPPSCTTIHLVHHHHARYCIHHQAG